MNRRDIFKSLLGVGAVALVAKPEKKPKFPFYRTYWKRDGDKYTYVVDTDDRYFDNWLDNHNKDEMHL